MIKAFDFGELMGKDQLSLSLTIFGFQTTILLEKEKVNKMRVFYFYTGQKSMKRFLNETSIKLKVFTPDGV